MVRMIRRRDTVAPTMSRGAADELASLATLQADQVMFQAATEEAHERWIDAGNSWTRAADMLEGVKAIYKVLPRMEYLAAGVETHERQCRNSAERCFASHDRLVEAKNAAIRDRFDPSAVERPDFKL